MNETVVRRLARAVDARITCVKKGNEEWISMHEEEVERLCALLPSGSGWDLGTQVDLSHSTGERLVLRGSYHHMDENGSYDGWTEHEVVVRASLVYGIDLRITGRNRNGIKDHIHDIFTSALLVADEIPNLSER